MTSEAASRTFLKWTTISSNLAKSAKMNAGCLDYEQQDSKVLREKHIGGHGAGKESQDSNLCLPSPSVTYPSILPQPRLCERGEAGGQASVWFLGLHPLSFPDRRSLSLSFSLTHSLTGLALPG